MKKHIRLCLFMCNGAKTLELRSPLKNHRPKGRYFEKETMKSSSRMWEILARLQQSLKSFGSHLTQQYVMWLLWLFCQVDTWNKGIPDILFYIFRPQITSLGLGQVDLLKVTNMTSEIKPTNVSVQAVSAYPSLVT